MLQDLRRKLAAALEAMEDDWRYLMVIASLQKGLPIGFEFSAGTGFVQTSPQTKKQPGSRADICGGWHFHLALQCTLDPTSWWTLAAVPSSTASMETTAAKSATAMEATASTESAGSESTAACAAETATTTKATHGTATNVVSMPDDPGRVSTSGVERM